MALAFFYMRVAPRGLLADMAATAKLALPIAAGNLAMIAIQTTDIALLGRVGPLELGAAVLAANLYFAHLVIGLGFAHGVSPILAQAIGRGAVEDRALANAVGAGLQVCLAISVLSWLSLWHTEDWLLLLGQAPEAARRAAEYQRGYMWSALPFLAYQVLRNYTAALERPTPSLWITVVAILINAIVVWALIHGRLGLPAWGLFGAGVGSTIASLVMAGGMVALVKLDRGFARHGPLARALTIDRRRLWELVRIGTPIAGTLAFEVTVFNAAAFVIGAIDEAQVAAHAIALQLAAITFMIPMGIAQAATVRVGLAVGRADPLGIRLAGASAYATGLAIALAAALAMLLLPETLIGLFVDAAAPSTAATVAVATGLLAVAAAFQIADSAQAIGAGALRGLKDTTVPMVLAGLGYWGFGMGAGSALAFSADLGALGIWIGLAIGLAVVAIAMAIRWRRMTV
jgi:MATE family multidrug resistance protein